MRNTHSRRRAAAATLIAIGLLATAGSANAQEVCSVSGPLSDTGHLGVVVDGDTLVAMPMATLREMTGHAEQLEDALALIDSLEAVHESGEAYLEAANRQQMIADSLIAAQRAQILDYEQLVALLEKLVNRGRILSAEFGAGYTVDGRLSGVAGLGLGRLRILGLVQEDDVGLAIGGSVPIF